MLLIAARAENDKLRAALAQARPFVRDELTMRQEGAFGEAHPYVASARAVLNAIDAALAEKEP